MIKTIGDEVDDRRLGPRGPHRLGGGLPEHPDRASTAADRDPLRASRSIATATTSAATSTSPSRVAARSGGGEVLVTRPVVEHAGAHLEFERIAEVRLKGFRSRQRSSLRACPRRNERARDPGAGASPRGCSSAGRPVVVLLSGGRDSTCLLDLAVRIAGRRRGRRAARQLRPARRSRRRRRATLRRAVRAARRPARGAPSGRGARHGATSRPGRATSATAPRPGSRSRAGADVAAGHTATDQVETILYRLASSPSRRALLGMRAREGHRSCGRCSRSPASRPAPTASSAACDGARTRATSPTRLRARARQRATSCPRCAALHPAAEANVLALVEILRDEAAVLDDARRRRARGPRRDRARAPARAARRRSARLVVQRLADQAAGTPAPGVARAGRRDRGAARSRGRPRWICGGGVRAVAEYGVLRFERTTGAAGAGPSRSGCRSPGGWVRGRTRSAASSGRRRGARACSIVRRSRRAARPLVAARRPDVPARPGRQQVPPGPVHRAARAARAQRASVPVVESDGEIVWVAGVATSERFKVTRRQTRRGRAPQPRVEPTPGTPT